MFKAIRKITITKDNIGNLIFLPCVSSIRKDKYGRLWVVTFSGEGILIESCRHMGNIWVSFGDTLVEYDNHKWGVYVSTQKIEEEVKC